MKVQYIASACVLIECHGVRVLCDPWMTDGIYYGSWYHYPPMKLTPEDFSDVDYIYISHIHPDHLDPATLRRLPKDIPVVILEFEEKYLFNLLQKLGFTKVTEVPHTGTFQFADDFSVKFYAADNCDPAVCGVYFQCHMDQPYKKTLQIDSLSVFQGGGKVLINTNDCPFSLASGTAKRVKQEYPQIDFHLVGYSGAGAYPQCFSSLDSSEKIVEAEKHRQFKLMDFVGYLKILQPKAFMPFAGLYLLAGRFAELNEFISPPKWEQLPTLIPKLMEEHGIHSKMVLLNEGEWYDIDTETATAPFVPPQKEDRQVYINEVLAKKKLDYENDPLPEESFLAKLQFAQRKMVAHQKYYGEILTDTKFYIDAGESGFYYIPQSEGEVTLVGREAIVAPYLIVELDPRLLARILDKKAHWNNAEVGSHLTFSRDPNVYQRSIHHFMSYLHC